LVRYTDDPGNLARWRRSLAVVPLFAGYDQDTKAAGSSPTTDRVVHRGAGNFHSVGSGSLFAAVR